MLRFASAHRRACRFALAVLFCSQTAGVGAAPVIVAAINRPPSSRTAVRVTRPAVAPIANASAAGRRGARALATGVSLLAETFSGSATTANAWVTVGDACLTAGSSVTPPTSIPACGVQAPADAAGAGALQLTNGTNTQLGMIVSKTALPTANGLQISFNDYAFNGTTPGADGITFFLSDASKPVPTAPGSPGGSLAYANGNVPGIANAYVGVGLDEYGNFSNATEGRVGGPGSIAETIAVRGSSATNWAYLGGAQNAAGKAASLPFTLDTPAATTRPANAPTIVATLTPAGLLTVSIDRHDGNGALLYYSQTIVGVSGQPAVPANVYFGFTASTGGSFNRHQIGALTVAAPPAALQAPAELRSAGGSLTFNLTAQADPVTGQPEFSYNGSTVPPTLRLLPGDTLNVNFTNALPTPPSGALYTNLTNLHYHGLHVSPQAPGDDSIDMVAAPGQTLNYQVNIPANHATGLYWYHTHAHGESERQTLSGMSGALIIDGIVTSAPQVANLPERVLIVRDALLPGAVLPNANLRQIGAMHWAMAHGVVMHSGAQTRAAAASSMSGMSMPGMTMHATSARTAKTELHTSTNVAARNPYVTFDRNYRRFVRATVTASTQCSVIQPAVKAWTVNGQTQPSIGIRPGEQQFWRVVNAGADTYLDLQVDNTTMNIVALDGVPLGSGVNTPTSMAVSHWVLPPASRVEFIVTGPPAGTTAYLRTNCFDSGSAGQPMPAAVLASINPNVSLTALSRIRHIQRYSPAAHAVRFRSAARLRAMAVSNTRTIFYSDQNNINGVVYDPAAPPMFFVQSGTTEEWTIQNNSSQVHTFHIHQVHFVVEAINGVTQVQQFVMDNVNVPAATPSGPGSVKVLLDFTDPTIIGTFLLHCHILSHEDAGMMAKIRIGTAPPMQLSSSSATFASASASAQGVSIAGGQPPYAVTGCTGVASASVSTNTVLLSPVAAGGCLLTIADSSNPSITASVVIQVNSRSAVVTLSPNSLSFASPNATQQSVTINGGTAPYGLSGCNGIALGSINAQTLTALPQAVGACTLVVTDANSNTASLSVSINNAATGNPQDNVTFHQNAMRSGWYSSEATLTTTNVSSAAFGVLASLTAPAGLPAFGKVYAQPLYVTNENGPDGLPHNLVVVATSTDQVYAFDEQTRGVVWHRDYTNAAAGIRQQLWTDMGCPDINPNIGITGTPVIDRAKNIMYLVAATMENGTPFLRLHAIALSTGNELLTTPITGSVTLATGGTASLDPLLNNNRSALLEANGNVYVALASHCDAAANTTHGWMVAYSASTLQETSNLVDFTNADPGNSYFLGSPWMGGYGPAADALGNVYFATGNGAFNGTTDFAMSVMKLPGNLNLGAASYFAPASAVADSTADNDLGSGGVMLLPDQSTNPTHLLIQGGKCGVSGCMKYILNRDAMGGQQTGDAGAVWKTNTGGGIWGGPAYFQDASGAQYIVYGGGQPLSTYVLRNPVGLAIQSSANVGCLECRDSGSQPVVSSNGTTAGTAIVWALKTPGGAGGAISLYAFDALQMSHTLFTRTAGSWMPAPTASYVGGALVSPLVANGKVYVPVDGAVTVFGLQ